jgi:hypothetical protein
MVFGAMSSNFSRGDRVNILNKLKANGVCFGLCVAGSMFWSRAAKAEVTLFDKDGWTFAFDGRINAFLSGGKGDDFPIQTPGQAHTVMGSNSSSGQGIGDVGWRSSVQQDKDNKYTAVRVRSGMFGNVLGFALTRKLNETTNIRGYIAIWSTIETLGRDKWAPVTAEAREGYFTVTGPWGSASAGRMLGWLGRTSYEIDVMYGHGYGLGLPCTDALGPACGHIGTGVLFPGYSAGLSYSTPSLAGFKVHAGLYDPVVFNPGFAEDWSHATFLRPEGSITFDRPLGDMVKLKVGVEGLVQPIGRVRTDPVTNAKSNETSSVWGVSGGARAEIGPVRLGAAAFRGRGIGLGYAVQRSAATSDNDGTATAAGGLTYQLRSFTGFYGQAGVVVGDVQLAAGYGRGSVDQLPVDKRNPNLSVFHSQTGISAAVYYHASDSIVLGLDYFRYMASWYGAPFVDANGQPTGGKLAGEKQNLNFLNAGVTYHW